MEENFLNNRVELCGAVESEPVFSHESRGIRFYTFPLLAERLSGTEDRLNVLVRERELPLPCAPGETLWLVGELRSYNNRSGQGSRLVITVLARELYACPGGRENRAELRGTVCREPVLRSTPRGREICDLMLAVNRRYGRSDYIPCIVWGGQGRNAARCAVGTRLAVTGRIQSRKYVKILNGSSEERTAFELSCTEVEPL